MKHCSYCGNEHIEVLAWVNANDHSFVDYFGRQGAREWYANCDECQRQVRVCDKSKSFCQCGETYNRGKAL